MMLLGTRTHTHTHRASRGMINIEIGAISQRTPMTAGKPTGVPRGKEGFLWFQRKGGPANTLILDL